VLTGAWRLSWLGLRPYLDNAWFEALLAPRANYYYRLPYSCIDGNLESVLDEQMYMQSTFDGAEAAHLADDLVTALRLRRGSVRFAVRRQSGSEFLRLDVLEIGLAHCRPTLGRQADYRCRSEASRSPGG
jgi:hypothetical protein